MDRRFIIGYSVAAIAIAVALVVRWPRSDRSPAGAEPETGRLSALPLQPGGSRAGGDTGDLANEIRALEADKERLENRLRKLLEPTTGEVVETVPLDVEAFCQHYGMVLRDFLSLEANDILAVAIELSDYEREALNGTTAELFARLQKLDRRALEVVSSNDKQIRLKVPFQTGERAMLFARLQDDLEKLLGPGRARIAAETIYRNELIGPASCERNLSLEKSEDGNFVLSTEIVPVKAYFPGTEKPYDGSAGVEPELFTTRGVETSRTVSADLAEKHLGGLIDLNNWAAWPAE